ncbi:hypothetical protein HZU67_02942 [Apis mellifera carnica]|nr:hypothetical protein HZU67_02942 [Apis mellifera carnica]
MKIQQPWEAKSIFKIILKKLKMKGGEKERKGKEKKGMEKTWGGEGGGSKEVKSGYGRSQIAGDAAKGKLAFVGRKERGIIRAEVV